MKKDRNTFFTNYTAQQQAYMPNPPQVPYQASGMETYQYSGPAPMNNYQTPVSNYQSNTNNDIENRLNRIERQLNRLENRVSALENQNIKINPTDTNYQNMYMI